MRCPICRDEVEASSRRPFCSERCQRIDLANWLGEEALLQARLLALERPRLQESLLAEQGPRADDEGPSWD